MSDIIEQDENSAAQGEVVEARDTMPVGAETLTTPPENSFMGIIVKLSQKPDINIEAIERFSALFEKEQTRIQRAEFDRVLAIVQGEIPTIIKGKQVIGKGDAKLYKYATWADINAATKPILKKYGMGVRFVVDDVERGLKVTCVLSYQGHREETSMTLGLDSAAPAMNNSQNRGATISYGKRYTFAAAMNIVLEDEKDTDGVTQDLSGKPLSADQVKHIQSLLEATNTDTDRFLTFIGSKGILGPNIEDIDSSHYPRVVSLLENKKKKL